MNFKEFDILNCIRIQLYIVYLYQWIYFLCVVGVIIFWNGGVFGVVGYWGVYSVVIVKV